MAGCVYQDENICILDPKDPQTKTKGVLVFHVIGYMESIGEDWGRSLFDKVKREGLKSSGKLLENKGAAVPTQFNENNSNDDTMNNSARLRHAYMEANRQHFNRIFLRPPSTAPFVYENGAFRSAGPWRSFLGSDREVQGFFGGQTIEGIAKHTAEAGNMPAGIAIARVDPDRTYVFYESIKDAVGDHNKATGIKISKSYYKKESKEQRFLGSRMRLSDFLDQLERNLNGETLEMPPYAIRPNQIVESNWEVLATTPNLPPSVFVDILPAGDTSLSSADTEGDKAMRKYDSDLAKRMRLDGDKLTFDVESFFGPFRNKISGVLQSAEELNKTLGWEVKTRGKFKTEEAKKAVVRELRAKTDAALKDFMTSLKEEATAFRKTLLPIQRNYATDLGKNFESSLQYVSKVIRSATQYLGNAKGGARTRSQKYKVKQTRRTKRSSLSYSHSV
jgi:hypothetical protein